MRRNNRIVLIAFLICAALALNSSASEESTNPSRSDSLRDGGMMCTYGHPGFPKPRPGELGHNFEPRVLSCPDCTAYVKLVPEDYEYRIYKASAYLLGADGDEELLWRLEVQFSRFMYISKRGQLFAAIQLSEESPRYHELVFWSAGERVGSVALTEFERRLEFSGDIDLGEFFDPSDSSLIETEAFRFEFGDNEWAIVDPYSGGIVERGVD